MRVKVVCGITGTSAGREKEEGRGGLMMDFGGAGDLHLGASGREGCVSGAGVSSL